MSNNASTSAPKSVRKRPQVLTPRGVAAYPRLETPDTKFNPDGEYSVQLRLPEAECADFIKTIKAYLQAEYDNQCALLKKKKLLVGPNAMPFKRCTNEDGTPTGEIEIKMKLKAKVTLKSGKSWEQRPAIFDAAGKPLKDTRIGSGSILKVSCEVNQWYTAALGVGVSLWIRAVQVIEYVPFTPHGAGNASEYGFGTEEGGYVGESLPVDDNESKSPFDSGIDVDNTSADKLADSLDAGQPAGAIGDF